MTSERKAGMAGGNPNHVLVTAVAEELSHRVSELLRLRGIDVHRAPFDKTVLELVQTTSFDAVVVGYPVSEKALQIFLDSARADGAACRRAGLILVTESNRLEEAQRLVGKGANRVVLADRLDTALIEAIADLGRAAPRVSVRAPAQIKLFADGRPLRVMAQIENLSTSGMLLRGVTQFPVGTTFDFEILAQGESRPICGTAEITRATDPEQESVKGVGVRFVSFIGSDRLRLDAFIDKRLPPRVPRAPSDA
jgi:CheY-like chemotaxis protein